MFKAAAQNAPTTWTEGPQFTQMYGYVQDGLGQMADNDHRAGPPRRFTHPRRSAARRR